MDQAGRLLHGKKDFASFQAAGSERATTVRNVTDIFVKRQPREFVDRVVIEIEADGFLYNMVRNIVGTLVEIGRGERPVEWIAEVLDAKDRKVAGATAPAHGLFLLRVDYDF